MKIMLICDSMRIGGAETHVLGLAKGLSSKGHHVIVVAKRGALAARLLKECSGKGRFVELYPEGRGALELLRYTLALGKLIKKESPSVVHAHSRASAFAVRILRGIGAVPRFAFAVTAHAKYRTNILLKRLSFWGDECIAVSDDIKSHLVTRYGVPSQNITVIPNGIDTDEFSPQKADASHTILFASRLDGDSSLGARCLIKAADELTPKYPDVKITIAGGGEELDGLRRLAANKSITFVGGLPSLCKVMTESELVIGVSRVALEAMACEKNVILFGNEGAIGLVDDEKIEMAESTNFTCRGFGVGDTQFLFNEIDRFFLMDNAQKAKMASANRRYVLDNHSQNETTYRTIEVYEDILAPRVLVGGYYGFGNMGDETLLSALFASLKNISPRSSICVLNKTKKSINGVRFVNRYSPVCLVREMRKADVFILGGGSLLQNATSTRSLLYYCALIGLSKAIGCKCVLLSNGIGPLKSRLAVYLASNALKKADQVGLRDDQSLTLAKALGKKDALLGADLCFSMDLIPRESRRVRNLKSKIKNGYVLVALKGGAENKDALVEEIKCFCAARGLVAVFVAMDETVDARISKKSAEECSGIFIDNVEREELLSLLSDAEAVVGERLHFLIFSLSVRKGFVGVGNAPKITSFVAETLKMRTLDPNKPQSLARLIDLSGCFSSEELLEAWQKYKRRSQNELRELEKAFFI